MAPQAEEAEEEAEEAEEAEEEAEEAAEAVEAVEAVGAEAAEAAEAAGGGTPYQEHGDAPESMRSPSMQVLTTAPPSRVASTEAIFGGVEGLRSRDARVQAEAANRLWQVRHC